MSWVSCLINYSFLLKCSVAALKACVLICSYNHENLQAIDANEYKQIQVITLQVLEEFSFFFFLDLREQLLDYSSNKNFGKDRKKTYTTPSEAPSIG